MEKSQALSKSQQKVALLAEVDPLRFATSSIADIARRAEVSEATVVRAAQRLGYSGLPEYKSACIARHRSSASTALPEIMEGRLSSLGENVETSVIRSQHSITAQLSSVFTQPQYDTLLAGCLDARRIVFFGLGTAFSVAAYTALECQRNGINAASLTGSGHSLADAIFSLKEDDCAVTFAPLNYGVDPKKFSAAAARISRRSVVITQIEEPQQLADDLLWIQLPSTSGTPASETFVLWTFMDIVIARLSVHRRDKAMRARKKLQEIRQMLKADQ